MVSIGDVARFGHEAVCAVQLGSMETIHHSWQVLSRWAEANGWSPQGPCREIYLRADPPGRPVPVGHRASATRRSRLRRPRSRCELLQQEERRE